jgi:hypothetical protein
MRSVESQNDDDVVVLIGALGNLSNGARDLDCIEVYLPEAF